MDREGNVRRKSTPPRGRGVLVGPGGAGGSGVTVGAVGGRRTFPRTFWAHASCGQPPQAGGRHAQLSQVGSNS